jgi:A/G-specific adenine glycosylase
VQAAILAWYDARGRALPFRGTRDPYRILVSETMAQQTQIARVGPAWAAFVARFPTFAALAQASTADVLRAWQGLGYNRRALNLQRAARAVVDEHAGALPRAVGDLERLPGIGPYTARAVASIAFGEPVAAVDTNVRRVIGRVVAGDAGALRPVELQRVADSFVPPDRAADWTHAVMDVGATFCRSSAPACAACPAAPWCAFRAAGAVTPGAARRATSGAPLAGPQPPPRPAFETSTRWLRGRIVDRARATHADGWTSFREPIGPHPVGEVVAMLAILEREGLLERHPADPAVARLPMGRAGGSGGAR